MMPYRRNTAIGPRINLRRVPASRGRTQNMTAELFKVIARFTDIEGYPLHGAKYRVKLLDKDRLFNDRLGAVSPDKDGVAEFVFAASEAFSIDSPGERQPDIYFVVTSSGREIFRSEILPNVNFDLVDRVTGQPEGLTKEFGPFQVRP
jgi:hypothetical protein